MPSILERKDTAAPSVFQAAALLRKARRQKELAAVDVPRVCVLDPDGDIVRQRVGRISLKRVYARLRRAMA